MRKLKTVETPPESQSFFQFHYIFIAALQKCDTPTVVIVHPCHTVCSLNSSFFGSLCLGGSTICPSIRGMSRQPYQQQTARLSSANKTIIYKANISSQKTTSAVQEYESTVTEKNKWPKERENNPTKSKTQKHEDNKRSNKEAGKGITEKRVY